MLNQHTGEGSKDEKVIGVWQKNNRVRFSNNDSFGCSPLVHPDKGWYDPRDWYFTHRPGYLGEVVITPQYTMNVRAQPSTSGQIIGSLAPSTVVTAENVVRDGDGGLHWWYYVRWDGSNLGYVAGFYWNGWGSDLYVGEPKRSSSGGGCGILMHTSNQSWLLFLPLFSLIVIRLYAKDKDL